MIAAQKTMDVPRHVLQTYFETTDFPLIQHHLDSYNALLETDIPTFLRVSNPMVREVPDRIAGPEARRQIRVYLGGKDGTKLRYTPPTERDGAVIVPHACRLDNRTYAVTLRGDIDVEYEFNDGTTELKTFADLELGKIPLMLRSKYCYLNTVDPSAAGECTYELGGYFIIGGTERVLVTQEVLGDNMLYAGVRQRTAPKGSAKALVEKDNPITFLKDERTTEKDLEVEEVTETYVGLKSMSEDGTRGSYSHFLVLPAPTLLPPPDLESMVGVLGRDRRLALVQLPGFSDPVPLLSVFRALGCASDRDLYETVLAGVSDPDRLLYDEVVYQIVLSHERFLAKEKERAEGTGKPLPIPDLDILAMYTRTKSRAEVVQVLHESIFSHIEDSSGDTGVLFRRKAYALGEMLRMALDVEIGRRKPSDRDNMQFKRFKTSGVLCFEEFKRAYTEMKDDMLLAMDRRVQYEAKTYTGKNLSLLLVPETIQKYWRSWKLLASFESSFKGAWGGKLGVGDILARPSYLAAIHHLRLSILQIDRTISTAPPRRLIASQFGIVCPIDSPDGSDIGYKKALTVLARISTAVPTATVREALVATGLFRATEDIHPSTWRPEWTPVRLNSQLVGVCLGNTEEFHRKLLAARRSGQLAESVSLSWMRINNAYTVYCDAGRPIRPVYREGVTPEKVLAAKTWDALKQLLDFVDASESDSLLLSMEPFHPEQRSEIHMTMNYSVATNLVPFSDHNPSSRSVFSIAQQKQAASWYHTNYQKRFDTIAMMAVCPQKPLAQTWMYSQMMGRGGCMPYGENAIVAITMYGGQNQEDSVTLNAASLARGMYRTMYWHSYKLEEEILDPVTRQKTEFSNPLRNETIKRREGMDYSQLDANGIVRVGTVVKETTILVGHLRPSTNPAGQTTYRDISMELKKGQHGRVDAVYTYSTPDGRRGVKIRILEERYPVLGDKMASRHSQKGTVGQVLDEADMPFTASGLRPDLIFNPHGIPTRMTMGQFLEMASNKLGVHLGAYTDATPFTTTNRVGELRAAMLANGFEPYGHEKLYNGMTGEMMEADIFLGPIYYQRLKHMVADKINSRDTGPKTLMTHQPTQGRGNEGGLRIGEMERDALLAHGMSKFLTESLMERSDKATVQFNKELGKLDTSRDTLDMPYSMALFTQELESMHVSVQLVSASAPPTMQAHIPQTSQAPPALTAPPAEEQAQP
jgi:DNA-directed RNA polymerase II subunit RPB2